MSTSGGYHEYMGVFSTSGGYHEYIRGCSVHRGDTMSTSGDTMSTSGEYHKYIGLNIMSTLVDVQYIKGYHDACRGYHKYIRQCSVHWGIP